MGDWVAYIGAVLNGVGGVAGFFVNKAGKANPLSFAGLIGTVLFVIVIIAVSADLLRTSAASPADAPMVATGG